MAEYYNLKNIELDQEDDGLFKKINSPYKVFSLDQIEISAEIVDVHDGDSVTALMKVPIIDGLYLWKCRLNGLDTPELTSKDPIEKQHAIEARDFLKILILNKTVSIKCHKFDKYGRLLVNIYTTDPENEQNTIDISQLLISKNYGRFYDGRKKDAWTF